MSGMAAVSRVSMKPGRDRVDRDAARRELRRRSRDEADDAGLGRRVVGLAHVAAMPATDDRQTMRPPSRSALGRAAPR